jgi:hypothetical protein
VDSMSARKQPRDADAAQLEDDDASQATTQDSHWRAGVNRQAQPQAQQHQLTASQAAGAKRTANAMSTDERKAKRAAHAREVRAQQAAERATAAAAARAEAAAAQLPEQAFLNELIDEDNHTRRNDGGDWERMQHCDNVEWVAFKKYVTVDIWSEIKPVDLEPDGFFDLFKEWRESDEYNHAILGWPTPSSQLQQPPLAPKTPAEVRQRWALASPRRPRLMMAMIRGVAARLTCTTRVWKNGTTGSIASAKQSAQQWQQQQWPTHQLTHTREHQRHTSRIRLTSGPARASTTGGTPFMTSSMHALLANSPSMPSP